MVIYRFNISIKQKQQFIKIRERRGVKIGGGIEINKNENKLIG